MPFRDRYVNNRYAHMIRPLYVLETVYGKIHFWHSRTDDLNEASINIEIDEADNFVLPSGRKIFTVPRTCMNRKGNVGEWSKHAGWWQQAFTDLHITNQRQKAKKRLELNSEEAVLLSDILFDALLDEKLHIPHYGEEYHREAQDKTNYFGNNITLLNNLQEQINNDVGQFNRRIDEVSVTINPYWNNHFIKPRVTLK
jgi:hypothetical protein